ncbi:hypothetical protein [Mucilaginibacter sp.]|uniref:hypothetical protein n=1 Tax=Mucilaginibacter sp. TaxID=1882438 RepID=UPI0032663F2D
MTRDELIKAIHDCIEKLEDKDLLEVLMYLKNNVSDADFAQKMSKIIEDNRELLESLAE